ncbi:unnamed protein product [Gordionus sp. m RMFG-2023]
MTKETFYYILKYIKPLLYTKRTNFIKHPISVEEMLMICLRYLATGCRYPTLAYSFKIGISTVQKIISTTCQAIWQTLVGKHMPPPTLTDFERIAKEFEVNWNLPNCVGCIDGKHCRIRKPPHSGSGFYNYKHFFSVVLQGIVDAKGKFITVDVGSFGSESDGGVFANSKIYKMIENGEIQLPPSKKLPNSSLLFPHFFVTDDAYPLKSYILKPYKGILTPQQEAFNYRISRARIQFVKYCQFVISYYTTINKLWHLFYLKNFNIFFV